MLVLACLTLLRHCFPQCCCKLGDNEFDGRGHERSRTCLTRNVSISIPSNLTSRIDIDCSNYHISTGFVFPVASNLGVNRVCDPSCVARPAIQMFNLTSPCTATGNEGVLLLPAL